MYQSLQKKPKKDPQNPKYIHAVDVMDLNAKDKFDFPINHQTTMDSQRFFMMNLNSRPFDANEGAVSVEGGNQSQQLFMMYATTNGDGSATSVAFAGLANTNNATQLRTKQPRNIVTNSTQSMFAGTQR